MRVRREPGALGVEAQRADRCAVAVQPQHTTDLGRRGGVSTGVVAGLNAGLGTGDEPEAVTENRGRAVAAAPRQPRPRKRAAAAARAG